MCSSDLFESDMPARAGGGAGATFESDMPGRAGDGAGATFESDAAAQGRPVGSGAGGGVVPRPPLRVWLARFLLLGAVVLLGVAVVGTILQYQ